MLDPVPASTEPDEKKVGLILNHIGEEGLDIYDTFTFLPALPNPIQGQPALPMEDPNHYETVREVCRLFWEKGSSTHAKGEILVSP